MPEPATTPDPRALAAAAWELVDTAQSLIDRCDLCEGKDPRCDDCGELATAAAAVRALLVGAR